MEGSSALLLVNGRVPAGLLPICRLMGGVCRLMGVVCNGSEVAAFCPLMCGVTMETGALAGTTEIAMPCPGGLMRDSGFAPTGQLLTASFCGETQRTRHRWPRPPGSRGGACVR